MSADWFCKIGEKKYGPLNGQQLKTIVAKGQLKAEHLVRRGSEGPWVPAGRIKGLFPQGGDAASQGKKLPQATAKPLPKKAARAGSLPTAAAAPSPPTDIPQELTLGGHHKHHVEMNVGNLDIETMPVNVSRRKLKTGLKGLKKDERKKLTIVLTCFIGGGLTIGVIVFVWGIASGKFAGKPEETAKAVAAASPPADTAGKTAKDTADKGKAAVADKEKEKPKEKQPDKQPEAGHWPKASVDSMTLGNVQVMVLKPTRGAPPEAAKVKDTDVLILPVRLNLKGNAKEPVKLSSWMDDSLQGKVSLKDDQDKSYILLAQYPEKGWDGTSISSDWKKIYLVFEAPGKTLKYLHLTLPSAAFKPNGPMIYFEIGESYIPSGPTEKADK